MHFLNSFSFTKKYVFALSLIASFSIAAFFNVEQLINSQSKDGEVINMSGRQRMLSQKIALHALDGDKKELQKSLMLMLNSHYKLLSLPMSKEIEERYYNKPYLLDKKVKEYIKHAQNYLQYGKTKDLNYILSHSQTLLKELDKIVFMYQNKAEEKVIALHQRELYLLLLTLLTLLFEAFFIFKPTNDAVNKKTKELLEEKNYSDTITQANTNAIIAVNENFEILTFNKSAEHIFGFSAKEMLHTKLIDDRIIPLKYLDNHNKGLSNFMKTGKLKHKNETFELEAKRKDGTIFPIRVSFGIQVDKHKKLVVANIQDITYEKQQEQIFRQQTRLAQMGEMISMIAHQWRQPLGAISSAIMSIDTKLKLNKFNLDDKEDRKKLLELINKKHTNILNYVDRLSQTIDDFRNFFKPNKEKELTNLTTPIEHALEIVEPSMISKGIKIEKDFSINPKVAIYKNELMQVILNLLKNAQDNFLEKHIVDAKIKIFTAKDTDHYKIVIEDNGGGIDEEILPKIFDPYFSTKDEKNGTGLGLYMSKTIVEEHHKGVLNVKNSENGVVFEIILNKTQME